MTQAICTPTETREEFESILRELDGVGVKWASGQKPFDIGWDRQKNYLVYRISRITWWTSSVGEQLPRAEFISAIKRDFAPKIDCSYPTEIKEKPKMKIYTDITHDALVIISEQLEEKSTVKWCGGDKPTTMVRLEFNEYLAFNYDDSGGLSHGLSGTYSSCLEKVTNKEFVDRIVEKFPKEKPKMNYNKMTKAELINKLKFENACNDELRSNYGILKDENELHRVELGRLQGQNRKCFEQITSLEKTNAEQAATIENIRNRSISIEEVARMAQGERDNAKYALRIANAENTRIKRLAAQILCPDVLEGK